MFTIETARELLTAAGLFAGREQTINLSDTFAIACSDDESVSDEELPAAAELFWRYGWCGVLFWVANKREYVRCGIPDTARFVQFVRQEESFRRAGTQQNKHDYTIGGR